MTICRRMQGWQCLHLWGLRDLEDEGIEILVNFENHTPTDASAHSRRSESLATPI